ncbi:MAG: hypothetical protein B7Y15_02275 [Bacteroidetes bacterium 24-39-8]|jgi:hypothetical protein|nr:MAG: hypothetical protein B7Y15_02275 [Bacteroidetes bacterium 24-39-8]HQR92867.1 hypothetical protein [Sediminibacterium sp.]HQS53625.1 hypothetical protein [Sediminibacterium sp.]
MKKQWLQLAFFNLFLVASIGVILRYKIAFSLPFIDQKHLLHGHSHFAFSGWVTHLLMTLLIGVLSKSKGNQVYGEYKWYVYANLFSGFGMLLSFPIQGYGLISISFSTLSILISYAFTIKYWKDLNRYRSGLVSSMAIKFSLLSIVIASLGTFALAFMMVTKNLHQNWYLASVYFYLHFQYNGWFFFAILGLFVSKLELIEGLVSPLKKIVQLFGIACIPAYFLSALWLPIPIWAYWMVLVAAILQVIGLAILIKTILKAKEAIKRLFSNKSIWLFQLAGLAFTIKILLQLGSTIPNLSQLAFGFRPIVIGYLHLVLLGFISIFLIAYTLSNYFLETNNQINKAIGIFVFGIIVNEILLMAQGIAALKYWGIPMIDLGLLFAALILFIGVSYINLCLRKIEIKE